MEIMSSQMLVLVEIVSENRKSEKLKRVEKYLEIVPKKLLGWPITFGRKNIDKQQARIKNKNNELRNGLLFMFLIKSKTIKPSSKKVAQIKEERPPTKRLLT
jgi:hypothetical protein